MLKLTQEQFQIYLPIYIMEKVDATTVPEVMFEYIIPNEALHKFITLEMIEAWNNSVTWDSERKNIEQHINWYTNTSKMNELEDWLTCWVTKINWETDQLVEVEFLDEDMEEDFLKYVVENFKYDNGFSEPKEYQIVEYQTDIDTVRELICID